MRRKYTIALSIATFLLALGITLYPVISNRYNAKHQSQIHTAYQQAIQQTDYSALKEAKALAQAYNEAIRPGPAEEGYSQESLAAAAADYVCLLNITGEGLMGYVDIPKLHTLLPIYHGTEANTLERGVGHLLGSSLPVGGENTHAILTGHSGMPSQVMFSDLGQIKTGDVFYLHVLGEVLAYQVSEIHTVLPHEVSLLGVRPGEDLCTLVTCTPYGVNTHRLLVTGERIPYEEAEQQAALAAQEAEPEASTWEKEYVKGIFVAIGILVLILLIAFLYGQYQRYQDENMA